MPSAPDATVDTAGMWAIEPRHHGLIERARELWAYRYLWWYFAADTLKGLYRGSALGWVWLIMRASGPVGLNAAVFGGILELGPDNVPYFLFMLCGMTTWVLFERSLLFVTRSLERNRRLITKIYFPRLILPLAALAPGLLYLAVLLVVTGVTVVYFHHRQGGWYVTLQPKLLAAVAAILMSLALTVSVGLWTSVLQARYRDIRYGLRYVMPFWFYFTPIIYPASDLPKNWRWLASINPMGPIVDLYKWGTLGVEGPTFGGILTSLSLIVVAMTSGMWFFGREESASVDKL